MNIDNLYQELIIDHGTDPRNFHVMNNANHDAEGYNPLCGDKLHVYLHLDGETITDISFLGKGCAISTASASIMTEVLKGKTVAQATSLFKEFQNLLTTDVAIPDDIGKLAALAGVRKFPSRVKCATLAWHTFHDALKQEHK